MSLDNHHIAPSSANWIKKYFSLVDQEIINTNSFLSLNSNEELFSLVICRSGLVFGTADKLIFGNHLNLDAYTAEESLKLLFFESLLLVHLNYEKKLVPAKFIDEIDQFYGTFKKDFWRINLNLKKDNKLSRVESIINERIKVKSNVLESNFWLNSFSNVLGIVDIILFDEFKQKKIQKIEESYDIYSYKLIRGLILASKFDNNIEKSEQKIIDRFLSSANLSQMYETDLITFLRKESLSREDYKISFENKELSKIAFILSMFITEGTHNMSSVEKEQLLELGNSFGLNESEMSECAISCRSYLYNRNQSGDQATGNNIVNGYKDFSSKWIRILGRNKEKFINELKESKELISLIKKSTKQDLTKEEKEKIKTQFLDLLKAMPSVGIFLLPGGAILLPIILKIVPDLLPSAFKENQTHEN